MLSSHVKRPLGMRLYSTLPAALLAARAAPTIARMSTVPSVVVAPNPSAALAGRRGAFWAVRRGVRAGDARLRAAAARGGVPQGPGRPAVPAGLRLLPPRVRRPAQPAVLRQAPDRAPRRREGLPQARGPQPHRRPQDQQQHRPGAADACAWARSASSPRPAPASTASPPRPSPPLFGLKCDVYMGAEDVRRQDLNVFRMKLMGANVIAVQSGQKTLKDALNEAMRDWMGSVEHTHYIIGTVAGPHPFPMMVRDFQACIGREARQQCLEAEGRLPDCVVACVGGGSNAAGIFYAVRRRRGGQADRRRSRRPRLGARPARRQPLAGQARRAARLALLRPAGRRRPDRRRPLRLRRPRLPRRRPRARLLEGHRPRRVRQHHRRRGARRRSSSSPSSKASSPRWNPPTPSPTPPSSPPTARQGPDPRRQPLRPRRQGLPGSRAADRYVRRHGPGFHGSSQTRVRHVCSRDICNSPSANSG